MLAIAERDPMAAKKMGRPKGDRDDVTVKIDRKLATRAKVLAGHRGISSAELISTLLQGPLDKAYRQMTKEMDATEG